MIAAALNPIFAASDSTRLVPVIAAYPKVKIAMARVFLYKPRWAWEAAAALNGAVNANERYWRCLPREAQSVFGAVKIGQR